MLNSSFASTNNKFEVKKEESSEKTLLLNNGSIENINNEMDHLNSSAFHSYSFQSGSSKQKKRQPFPGFTKSFHKDAQNKNRSVFIACVIGIICGIAATFYYKALEWLLKFLWNDLPEKFIVGVWPEWTHFFWIPLIGMTMALGVGTSVRYVGDPGDFAYTMKAVHEKAFLSMNHALPMLLASQFSILGGGSLGPEAPLVAICACLGGFVSRNIFKETHNSIIRKNTLTSMAGALAAFFGALLGGSLFPLEVNNSHFGMDYFQFVIEAVFCGAVTLTVFRSSAGLPIGPIWDMSSTTLDPPDAIYVLIGILLGLLSAIIAALFANFHSKVMAMFEKFHLLKTEKAIQRALFGSFFFLFIGTLIPQTLFWGEYEFQQISTLAPAKDLPHVWPTSGLLHFEMDTAFKCFLVGVFKMISISFTIAGGYRGGFIFPFFVSGAAFGRALAFIIPSFPVPYACLCIAAGINVAMTRTVLSTSIILTYLAGQQDAMSVVLASSLISLFATNYMQSNGSIVPFPKVFSLDFHNCEHSSFYFDEGDDEENEGGKEVDEHRDAQKEEQTETKIESSSDCNHGLNDIVVLKQ